MEIHLCSSDSYSIQANSWCLTGCVEAIATAKIVQVSSGNNRNHVVKLALVCSASAQNS